MKFPEIWNRYPEIETQLLRESCQELSLSRPLSGITVLNNTPLTPETLYLVEGWLAAGANLLLTHTKFIRPHTEKYAREILSHNNLHVIEHTDDMKDHTCDILIDCGGELCGHIKPRIGAVELTQSGTIVYRQANPQTYPVISVDDSDVKSLETMCGTGKGFVDGFENLTREKTQDHNFLVIGYGRVGQGVVRAIHSKGGRAFIVDVNPHVVAFARHQGLKACLITENFSHLLDASTVVVTASGVPHLLSSLKDKYNFEKKILTNVGADDEYAPAFDKEEVLNSKIPVNFSLENPTDMHYLDPIFYSLQRAACALVSETWSPGYHALPQHISDDIINRWKVIHKEDINFIYDYQIFKEKMVA